MNAPSGVILLLVYTVYTVDKYKLNAYILYLVHVNYYDVDHCFDDMCGIIWFGPTLLWSALFEIENFDLLFTFPSQMLKFLKVTTEIKTYVFLNGICEHYNHSAVDHVNSVWIMLSCTDGPKAFVLNKISIYLYIVQLLKFSYFS